MNSRPHREPKRVEESTAPQWMTTLGDCISLLLTFFVLLISFSSLNDNQLMMVMGVVQGALGAVKMDRGLPQGELGPKTGSLVQMADFGSSEERPIKKSQLSSVQLDRVELKKQFADSRPQLSTVGSPVWLTLAEIQEGLVIRLEGTSLFDRENRLTPAAVEALGHAAELAANVGNEIRLVDCTRSDAAHGGGAPAMSWGRRIRRARAVGERLAADYGFAASRFGYGARIAGPDEQPAFELLLMDRIGAREVSLQDLWAAAGAPR